MLSEQPEEVKLNQEDDQELLQAQQIFEDSMKQFKNIKNGKNLIEDTE